MKRDASIGCAGVVLIAIGSHGCSDHPSVPERTPVPCFPDRPECAPVDPPASPGVLVENRTGGDLDLGIRAPKGLRIDERVVRGEIIVPISPALHGAEARVLLVPQQSRLVDDMILVSALPSNRTLQGGIVRAGDGPWFVVMGNGRVLARASGDGSTTFEPEDPTTVTVLPAEVALPECEAGLLEAPFEAPSLSGALLADNALVGKVTRDADGCRSIEVVDPAGSPITSMRACIPDAAYPFTDGDSIDFRLFGFGTETIVHLQNARGDHLELVRVNIVERTASSMGGLEFAIDEDPRCVRIDPTCGDVDVPVRLRARTADATIKEVATGEAIPHADGETTHFIVRAVARPVAAPSCSSQGALISRARAWIATVYRAPI